MILVTGVTAVYPAGTKFTTGPKACRIHKNSKVKCIRRGEVVTGTRRLSMVRRHASFRA